MARKTEGYCEVAFKLWGEPLASRVVRAESADAAKLVAEAKVPQNLRRLANEVEARRVRGPQPLAGDEHAEEKGKARPYGPRRHTSRKRADKRAR
jgi:hypothetical protein